MKKKFNIKIYGHKGFISHKEPYLISTTNFYLNLYELGDWYKSDDVKKIKVENDIFINYAVFCYKTMECLYFNKEAYFEKGGYLTFNDIKIDKWDFDFISSGDAFRFKFDKEATNGR